MALLKNLEKSDKRKKWFWKDVSGILADSFLNMGFASA